MNLIRGTNPWPGAVARTPRGSLTIWRASAAAGADAEPGTLVTHDRTLAVATADGVVLPREVQPENRRALAWSDWLRGARLAAGDRFETP